MYLLLIAVIGGTLIHTQPLVAAGNGRAAKLIQDSTLASFSLLDFGYSQAELDAAIVNGLAFTDLPAIGSGLQLIEGNHFLAVTDRGPNFDVPSPPALVAGKAFPLPQFTPTIVWFQAIAGEIVPSAILPIINDNGDGVTGIPNSATADSIPYADGSATTTIPFNPDGMDIEDIHTLPGGGFILVEEYAPSVVIVGPDGHVLTRYIPAGKTLAANYTVKSTLPTVFAQRRGNRGFEGLAVSADGRTAYTMTQSPMGSTSNPDYGTSQLIRVIRMDITDPLNLTVTGEFLFKMFPTSDFRAGNAQKDLKISAAAWVSPDRLLITEGSDNLSARGHKLVLVDMTRATDVLNRADASTVPLVYEKVTTDFSALGITPASTRVVADLFHDLPETTEGKLEGMTILNDNEIVISTDNDFGVGDVPGATTHVYTILLGAPLR